MSLTSFLLILPFVLVFAIILLGMAVWRLTTRIEGLENLPQATVPKGVPSELLPVLSRIERQGREQQEVTLERLRALQARLDVVLAENRVIQQRTRAALNRIDAIGEHLEHIQPTVGVPGQEAAWAPDPETLADSVFTPQELARESGISIAEAELILSLKRARENDPG